MFLEPRCLLFIFLLGILAISAHARSWDLAGVIGREIYFFPENRSLTEAVLADANNLTALAYDDTTRTLFLSDRTSNVTIFSIDLTEKNFTLRPLVKKDEDTMAYGMTFDTSSRTLFWADTVKNTIMKLPVPKNGDGGTPVLLHDLPGKSPYGIALDVCNRHIYWANGNSPNSSIERSKLDGSERTTIVSGDLYEVLGVAVDHREGKLYWADNERGLHFKIERSNLDGSDREIFWRHLNQVPVHVAVDDHSVYWTDNVHTAIWTMKKNKENKPVIFRSFHPHKSDPGDILARENVGTVDCKGAEIRTQKRTKAVASVSSRVVESYSNLTTSTEETSEMTVQRAGHCFNEGKLDAANGLCHCKSGFSGDSCEVSLCHNYCLGGDCTINEEGTPECVCAGGFTGRRCEKSMCDGFCFNDGECSIKNGKPTCKCKYSTGSRCEMPKDLSEICLALCASAPLQLAAVIDKFCLCPEMNHTAEAMIAFNESFDYGVMLPIFGTIIVALIFLIVVLSCYVNKLRRRPRIKKRFVVSKGGVTPLTSRPQFPDNQCEITIENCCNMNICETPCFEPKLRAPVSRDNRRKEEKNCLLDNMEGNSC